MNPVELTYNSWHRRFYEFWWVKTAPTNFCNYVWGLVLALLTLPLIAGRCIYEFSNERPESSSLFFKTFAYVGLTIVAALIGLILGFIVSELAADPVAFGLGVLIVVGVVVTTVLIVVIAYIVAYFFTESEVMKMTKSTIQARKQKVCPPITWKNE